MIKQDPSLDELTRVIKRLLRENRFSFSKEEKIALNECLNLIRRTGNIESKEIAHRSKGLAVKILVNFFRVLLRILMELNTSDDTPI
jgi:hypothetical protein